MFMLPMYGLRLPNLILEQIRKHGEFATGFWRQ
jgi:hypothetical protein